MTQMPYRVAIVGAGIGAEHAEGYRALPRHFTVVRVCDLDLTRAEALAASCDATATSDFDAVLGDPDIDLVDICLPPALHVSFTLRALAAGKHVICEKPVAASLREMDQIATAAKAAGRQVFGVFQYRYGAAARMLEVLARQEMLGPLRVATLETHWNRGADYYAVPWRGTKAHELGGVIVSHAIHIHDLMCKIGGPVVDVSASLSTAINPIETEDCAALWFRLRSGALVTSSVTLGAARDHSRLRLVFDKATIESGTDPYRPTQSNWHIEARDPSRAEALRAAIDQCALRPGPHHDGFAGYFQAISGMLARDTGDGLASARQSVELASAIYLSDATGASVPLPLGPNSPAYDGWAELTRNQPLPA